MAHKGKYYKLQFRRDFTLNRLQTLGAAECYVLDVLSLPINPTDPTLHFSAQALNLDKSDSRDATWTTEYIFVGSRRWRIRGTIIDRWTYPLSTLRWEIEDSVQGVIYRNSSGATSCDSDYGSFGTDDRGSPDFHKVPWPSTPRTTRIASILQAYDTYNP